MIINVKKISKWAFLAVAIYSIFTYLFAHLAYMNMNTDTGVVFEIISLYIAKITDFAVPMLVAATILVVYALKGMKSAIVCAILASLGRLLFTLPYYYIIYIYNYGYDSVESITLSLFSSVGIIAFTVIGAFLSLWIAVMIIRRSEGDAKSSIVYSLEENQATADFSSGANRAILIFAVIRLIRGLISEIIDTATFFLEYGLDYTMGEIATIMCNYVLLFALVAVAYLIGVKVKNCIVNSSTYDEELTEDEPEITE